MYPVPAGSAPGGPGIWCRTPPLHLASSPRARPRPARALPALRPDRHPVRARPHALAEHARPARARRGCSSTSCSALGLRRRRARRQRLRDGDAAGRPARRRGPVIGLIAHLDTTPDAPGAGVRADRAPRLRRRRDRAAARGHAARPGDDARARRQGRPRHRHRQRRHAARAPTTRPASRRSWPRWPTSPPTPSCRGRRCGSRFTPDEEIGEGASLFDIERFGALLRLHDRRLGARRAPGRVVHRGRGDHHGRGRRRPSRQATGKLVNALRLAARIVAALPADRLTPETTSGREGFIHPYELTGTPARAEIRAIVRDFDEDLLEAHVALLRATAEEVVGRRAAGPARVEVRRQYRNMRAYLEPVPEVVGGGRGGDPGRGHRADARRRSAAAPTARC